jgi:hypothetical protein
LAGVWLADEITADPFVRSWAANFYPAPAVVGSPSIIDSSLNTLQDRNEFTSVTGPLGIPPSPIIAPTLDIYGQLRTDDPAVASSPGLGTNPFKDRGAVDRVDRAQPTVSLATPLDASSDDKDSGTGVVRFVGTSATGVNRFAIQLADKGIGIDNTTVLANYVTVKYAARTGTAVTPADWAAIAPLDSASVNGYVFRYLENTKQIVLESNATFATGDYLVTLDNAQIADRGGNLLLNNDVNGAGTTAFRIAPSEVPRTGIDRSALARYGWSSRMSMRARSMRERAMDSISSGEACSTT